MITFYKIKHDINGNPRYVCHFLDLLKKKEKNNKMWQMYGFNTIDVMYKIAVKRSHKIGGRKYHTRDFGGGIVFQSYNIQELELNIKKLLLEKD